MRGHSSLRREPAVLLMYRGVEGYKEAEIALRSLHTQLDLLKQSATDLASLCYGLAPVSWRRLADLILSRSAR